MIHEKGTVIPVIFSNFKSFDSSTTTAAFDMKMVKSSVNTFVMDVDIYPPLPLQIHDSCVQTYFALSFLLTATLNTSATVVITVISLHFNRLAQSHKISQLNPRAVSSLCNQDLCSATMNIHILTMELIKLKWMKLKKHSSSSSSKDYENIFEAFRFVCIK